MNSRMTDDMWTDLRNKFSLTVDGMGQGKREKMK